MQLQNRFAKFALVAALCAAVPMLTVSEADAHGKRGDSVHSTGKVVAAKKLNKNYVHKPAAKAFQLAYRGFDKRHRHARNGCVAVGKTIRGRNIPGVRGRRFGPRACFRAMRECRRDLARRQYRGFNPFGRCVIARRF